jgi:hypothetical protein
MSQRGARSMLLAVLSATAGFWGCNGGDDDAPQPVLSAVSAAAAKSSLARAVDRYMIHYGRWDRAAIELAKTHDLVILHPGGANATRALVSEIQGGLDPADPSKRVLVLGYVTVGEDDRTIGLTPQQMRADARFVGDGTGPRVDPRGPGADGRPLTGLPPLGLPSSAGGGFASWYLDDARLDGPDANAEFGGCFVNAGDPKWFDVLQGMTLDGTDRKAGLREILTTTTGRGLGCDGVFLDTFDTAAPNTWSSRSKFEWTAAGFAAFTARLRDAYPDRILLQNRGLFFFNPKLPHYRVTTRPSIDFAFYESYRLNSTPDSSFNPHPIYYPDNRYNFTPKLMAEAGRPDGFRVLSLGYAAGSPDQMSSATLTGGSALGFDSLVEDVRVAQSLAGFRHYLTTPRIDLPNAFVRDHSSFEDHAPPVWTSTWNLNQSSPGVAAPPTPRVGIQQLVPGVGALTVRWDVALDLHPVGYALYTQTRPFDFASDPALAQATRTVLRPSIGAGYADAYGPSTYPYEAQLSGLAPGLTCYAVIRAFDSQGNEERNQVVLSGAPSGGVAELGRWRASNGVSDVTYRYQYAGAWDWKRVWIDVDRSTGTGYLSSRTGVGADLLIENGRLYRYGGTGTTWAWSAVSPGPVMETGAVDGQSWIQWTFPQAVLGSTTDVDLVFQIERPGASTTSPIYRHLYSPTSPTSPFYGYYAENDAEKIYYQTRIRPAWTFRQVFIDEDENATTGYAVGGIGAGYLIENGRLYRHGGSGWSWTSIGDAHAALIGDAYSWWIRRGDIGETRALERARLVFRGTGGSAAATSAVYTHVYSP